MQRGYLVTWAELPFWSVITLTALILYFGEWQESTVQFLYAGSLLLVLVLLISTSGNLLLVSRLGLLFAVGAYPLGVKLISRDLYFSVFEFSTQTLEITTIMYALTLLALLGAYWGWRIGTGSRRLHIQPRGLPAFDSYYATVFGLAALFATFAGALIVASSTGTIFEGAYGTGTEGSPALGSASAIGGIAISVMFYCCLVARRKAYWWTFAVVVLYLLVWCQVLRGLRQDAVSSIFSCVVLYFMYRQRDLSIKFKYIFYLLPAYLALELWGLVRSGLSEYLAGELSFQQLLDMGLGNAALMPDVVYAGTLGPIATTFANVVALFRWGEVDFIYGVSYFDFLLRTPPEFIYPDRPQDYAAMFADYGLSSGGGFFELAEAYLNFGPLGGGSGSILHLLRDCAFLFEGTDATEPVLYLCLDFIAQCLAKGRLVSNLRFLQIVRFSFDHVRRYPYSGGFVQSTSHRAARGPKHLKAVYGWVFPLIVSCANKPC